jgi:hypothetical protein
MSQKKSSTKEMRMVTQEPNEHGSVILYQTDDGQTRIDVKLLNETVWLTQKQMAELFQKDVRTINEHIKNIFEEGELNETSVIRNFRITASDQKTYDVAHYNLDVIISVGYRVKSLRGTQFRIWATERLREYIIKGFAMDDERLKQMGGGSYFDELLARIRDIRSSEKIFWKKVLDIYATSIDYDPKNDLSVEFFKIIQNKMHWAAHGHTAAEIISERADAKKTNMGLTSCQGSKPRRSDVAIAKNYLAKEELDKLNRIVSFYLDFAELQALQQKTMTMKDWIKKLDDFLKLSEQNILTHSGKVSHDAAIEKAHKEFDKYHQSQLRIPSRVEKDFEEVITNINKLGKKSKKSSPPS